MRTRLVAAALLALVAAAPVAAQDAKQDRAKAIAYLEETRAKFLKSVDGLNEAQWRARSARHPEALAVSSELF